MLEDKLPELIRLVYNIKILVTASYKAKETLAAKGLTPAIFLDPFYSQKIQNLQEISYNFKEKQIKPLPDYVTIDIDDYTILRKEQKNSMDDIDQQLLCKKMAEMLNEERLKYIRDVKKNVFQDRASIEKFVNNQGFHWFEKATKMYYHALTMGQDNYRVNTADQPMGVCYLIQVEKDKTVKEIFDKIKTESDYMLRKLYELNPEQIRNIKPILVVLFDVSKGNTVQQAMQYTTYLKDSSGVHSSLMYRLPINSEDTADLTVWSRFVRPVLHFRYDIKGSDPIRIVGEEDYTKLQDVINHHKETIRRNFQIRLDDLIKKHEDVNKVTKIIGNFFKGNTPNEKTYNKQQIDLRQLADKMFIVEDYKRAYDIYKNLAGKLEKRNAAIENNLSEMIQLCLTISKFHNLKIKSDPYNEIEKYVEKIFRFYETKSKIRLKKYLIFLVYTFHTFRTFNRQFIRSYFYPQIKSIFSTNSYLNVVPSLLYEQFANFNLFYKNVDYRRYCYDITRVASRFSDGKLYSYALRNFLIVENLYSDTFANIEKYQYTQLSHLFIEARNYKESLKYLKSSWEVYIQRMETEDLQKNQQQLLKLIQNYWKMMRQIEKLAPLLLNQSMEPNLKIPIIHSLNLQTKDEMLEFDEKSGIKWQEIGEAILDSKQLMSAGLNQKDFRNLFRSFDFGVPEQKYLIYRFNASFMSEAVLKKNSRNAFVGQPIKLTFYMRNPLRGDIDIENIRIKLKQNLQQVKIQTKCRQLSIISFKSSQVVFTLTPNEPGFLELEKIEWSFMKLLTYYQIKEPSQIKSEAKSCFFKLNVLPSAGCLESKAFFEDYYYEGERTRMKLVLKNSGKQKIDKVYLAPGEDQMFGFKFKQLNLEIQPNEQKQIHFDISIPLVHDTIQSGEEKKISKMLILYKTTQKYRVSRTINKFNILRIAKIEKILCERLSTHLHLLSFSKKKLANNDTSGLEWMIIPAGYQIVKNEAAELATQTNYFFFIRKGNYELSKFRFENWAKDIYTYPEQFFNFENTNTFNIRFFWRKQQKIGYISKSNIPVIVNEHGYLSSVFPISFKINYQKQISHNFKKVPYLQIPISIKLKNVLCNDELKVTINFIDSPSSDSTWEGVTQKKVNLKMGSQTLMDLKYVVVRPGTYLLSNEIKYSIVNNKAQFVNLTHSEYQKIYLTVKGQSQDPNKMDFEDAFKQFGLLQDSTTTTLELNIQPDSLI